MSEDGSAFLSELSVEEGNVLEVYDRPKYITLAIKYRAFIVGMLASLLILVGLFVVLVTLFTVAHFTSYSKPDVHFPDPPLPPTPPEYRLPRAVLPSHYEIRMEPHLESQDYKGKVVIHVDVKEDTKEILFHADESINILSLTIPGKVVSMSHDARLQQVKVVQSEGLFEAGSKLEIHIGFTGILNDLMKGFYRSSYLNEHQQLEYMVTTHMEAPDARIAFPCFDEPDFKATFTISLDIPNAFTGLSNMPVVSTEVGATSDRKLLTFAKTPKMSTYLVAFIAGRFAYKEHHGKVPIRVYATIGNEKYCQFALDVAVKVTDTFAQWFDIPYQLPKLDLIGIPDFAAGAMENWGLITFRLNDLLIDMEKSGEASKERVAAVVAHELAHQWTGNLVTASWWSTLWLNEGSATFFEYIGMDSMFPEWNVLDHFFYSDLERAMAVDARPGSHAIVTPANSNDEIAELFDGITYSKGGSILRMFQGILGDQLKQVFHQYLTAFSYTNANTSQFLSHFPSIEGHSWEDAMGRWVYQPGFPYVSIRSMGSNRYELTQKRYLTGTSAKDTQPWYIHMITHGEGSSAQVVTMDRVERKEVTIPSSTGYILLNHGRTGFFRVLYEESMLSSIISALRLDVNRMSPIDKAGMLGDLFAFVTTAQVKATAPLEMAKALEKDHSYLVWRVIMNGLYHYASILSDQECYGDFELYVRDLLTSAVNHVGWEKKVGDSHDDILLRGLILDAASYFGVEAVKQKALTLFRDEEIDADIEEVIYNTVGRYGDSVVWHQLLAKYRAEKMPQPKRHMLVALGKTSKRYLLLKTLEIALDKEIVRLQDVYYAVYPVARNPLGREIAWRWLQDKWDYLASHKFGSVSSLVRLIPGQFQTLSMRETVEKFFTHHHPNVATSSWKGALDDITSRHDWIAKNKGPLCTFVKRT